MNSESVKQKSTRKAAILIQLVNEELADFLLSKMPLADAAAVRQIAEELGEVTHDEQEQVIQEFLRQTGWAREDVLGTSAPVQEDESGVELQWSASIETLAPHENRESPSVSEVTSKPTLRFEPNQVGQSPLGFVGIEQASLMTKLIQNESSAVGAVMLSLLEPSVAARVLENFDENLRLQLLRSLSELDETHPEVIAEIVNLVRQELESLGRPVMTAGMQAVQRILDTSSWKSGPEMWNQLGGGRIVNDAMALPQVPHNIRTTSAEALVFSERNTTQVVGPLKLFRGEEKSAQIQVEEAPRDEVVQPWEDRSVEAKGHASHSVAAVDVDRPSSPENSQVPRMGRRQEDGDVLKDSRVVQQQFDALVDWPSKALIQVFKHVPPKVMMLAMTGAQPRMLTQMKKTLSRQQATRLERDIERSGPIRLTDIHKAQHAVLGVIEDLQEQGKVDIPKRLAVEA
jgi:flagellar motor switch protein FliG